MAFEGFRTAGTNVWEGSKNFVRGIGLLVLTGLALVYVVPTLIHSVGTSIAGVMSPDVFSSSKAIGGIAQNTYSQIHTAGMV